MTSCSCIATDMCMQLSVPLQECLLQGRDLEDFRAGTYGAFRQGKRSLKLMSLEELKAVRGLAPWLFLNMI